MSSSRAAGGGGGGGGGRGSGGDGSEPSTLSFHELLARVHVHPGGAISGEQVATLPLVSVFDLLSSASTPALYSRRQVPCSTCPSSWPTPAFPSTAPPLQRVAAAVTLRPRGVHACCTTHASHSSWLQLHSPPWTGEAHVVWSGFRVRVEEPKRPRL
jgi:hypothetical protein